MRFKTDAQRRAAFARMNEDNPVFRKHSYATGPDMKKAKAFRRVIVRNEQGWWEDPDETGKAPLHVIAASVNRRFYKNEDDKEFKDVLDKALHNLPQKERKKLAAEWIALDEEKATDAIYAWMRDNVDVDAPMARHDRHFDEKQAKRNNAERLHPDIVAYWVPMIRGDDGRYVTVKEFKDARPKENPVPSPYFAHNSYSAASHQAKFMTAGTFIAKELQEGKITEDQIGQRMKHYFAKREPIVVTIRGKQNFRDFEKSNEKIKFLNEHKVNINQMTLKQSDIDDERDHFRDRSRPGWKPKKEG